MGLPPSTPQNVIFLIIIYNNYHPKKEIRSGLEHFKPTRREVPKGPGTRVWGLVHTVRTSFPQKSVSIFNQDFPS